MEQAEETSAFPPVNTALESIAPWRICFVWNDGKINDVEIVDYH